MKRILITAAALLLVAGMFTSCGRSELRGFSRTETGLHYKFYVKTDSPRAQVGEIIVGEIWMYQDDELLFSNEGNPMPLFQVGAPVYDAGLKDALLEEALLMIGAGDSVKFAYRLEMFPHIWDEQEVDFLFHTIKVHGVYTEEEFEMRMQMEQMIGEAIEAEILAEFLAEEGITARPNDDGVYVIVTRRGSGAVASRGRNIQMHYVGRLIDGTVFDTSREDVAREYGLFTPMRDWVPLPFQAGMGQMIPGLDNAVIGMNVGTRATLIIPSNMAYGTHGMPQAGIPGFSTLVFDIEIVAVN
ncbi:MAG: FKBP-type peptidyl-prolyl cis-trans isomerase [Bacteroidales bacterium]|nr:FKBP-type peptidyl-prolyl cis-trans isomerase [Bacteroidales bacterium]